MRHPGRSTVRLAVAAVAAIGLAACEDAPETVGPDDQPRAVEGVDGASAVWQESQLAAWFERSAPEVLALPQTVFADHDEETGRLVFGVEQQAAIGGVERAVAALGIPASAYRVEIAEPIHFMTTLRDEFRPTQGGIQINFSIYVCTLGFNVSHASGLSFITNSHCSDKQGETDGTTYYQPSSSVAPTPIAFEEDDPAYFRGGECPRGRKCRLSDAARARYEAGIDLASQIAEPDGTNNGSITVDGSFNVASEDDGSTTFSGTMNKVGRTTGWTSGTVTNTCVDVNVSGSNITMLCQTIVENDGTTIVGGGDSGSPVFTGTSSIELKGILWGGNSAGDLFVFSPLSGIEAELGDLDAVNADGTGDGDSSGGGDGGGDDDDGGGNGICPPGNPNHPNCG